MRVLVVEDDAALAKALAFHLRHEGYDVEACHDGEEALYFMRQRAHDLVILDCMLPGMDGVGVLRAARLEGCAVPVLMLTALGQLEDRVAGLDAGADDYLVKPFETDELLARVRAIARRPSRWAPDSGRLTYADLSADPSGLKLYGPGGMVDISKREMQLLEAFLRGDGRTIPRAVLFLRVWGADADVEDANLDSYVHFLRKRLKTVKSAATIATVRGVGFRLEKA